MGCPYLFNESSQRNNLNKLICYDEPKKWTHDSKIVRVKTNLQVEPWLA